MVLPLELHIPCASYVPMPDCPLTGRRAVAPQKAVMVLAQLVAWSVDRVIAPLDRAWSGFPQSPCISGHRCTALALVRAIEPLIALARWVREPGAAQFACPKVGRRNSCPTQFAVRLLLLKRHGPATIN